MTLNKWCDVNFLFCYLFVIRLGSYRATIEYYRNDNVFNAGKQRNGKRTFKFWCFQVIYLINFFYGYSFYILTVNVIIVVIFPYNVICKN